MGGSMKRHMERLGAHLRNLMGSQMTENLMKLAKISPGVLFHLKVMITVTFQQHMKSRTK